MRRVLMKTENEYIRVGTTFYKVVEQPLVDGGFVKKLIPWKLEMLRHDLAKDAIAAIPKYDGFCLVPSHTQYKKVIGNFLNLYEPLTNIPESNGNFSHISSLIRHIFGEQYDLGMDYLQLLYLEPLQKLPILLLVSTERNTGKTTFLNFLKLLFEENATFNSNEEFRSQFNSDWAGKLLVLVDEVLLNRREDSERLKNLSTAQIYKKESKGRDKTEIQFFAKFVLCSNNESTPVIIEPGETRYWVRKIEPLKSDDPYFIEKIKSEIPAFLDVLLHRELSTGKESRMWFALKLIHTDALDKIIKNNRPRAELDMIDLCLDVMERMNINQYSFCPNDIHNLLLNTHVRIEKWQILHVLKERWNLKPTPNCFSYTTYCVNFNHSSDYYPVQKKGRYYSVLREFLEQLR